MLRVSGVVCCCTNTKVFGANSFICTEFLETCSASDFCNMSFAIVMYYGYNESNSLDVFLSESGFGSISSKGVRIILSRSTESPKRI
jgi:hypothetical protein